MEKPQILWIGRSYMTPFFSIKKHQHPYYHLIYIVKGTLRFELDDKTLFLTEGKSLLLPRGTNHAFFNDSEKTGEYLEIKFSLLKSTFESKILRDNVQESDSKLAGDLFKQIFDEYSVSDSYADDAAASYLLALLHVLAEKDRHNNKQQFQYLAAFNYSELSQKVIRYLEAHYHEELSLDSLAKEMNFNKSYLCVAFKKDTQLTILDCLNTIRIRRAAELIVYSEYSLSQVAEACGFASDSHFNRVFLKYVGITPGQCRRAYPAGTLDFSKDADTSAFSNNFMYSVLARKLISPQEVKKFDSQEPEV